MHICTVIARNYLAYARVLADSFRKHHPDGDVDVLIIDDVVHAVDDHAELFTVWRPEDLGLPPEEYRRMAMIYDVMELATAVKPFLLRRILEKRGDHAVYLDPDIEVHARLDELVALAGKHSLVLTPHNIEPMPRDGRVPSEREILKAGAFNMGFAALGEGSDAFLDWWCDRLRRDCISLQERHLFVDQRWIDLVPAYFPHHILRDPGYNVAYWNLATRTVRRDGESHTVEGSPLRFFHFSGFDPERPYLLSRFQGDQPRILLSEHPELASLCGEYAARLLEHGHRLCRTIPYRWGRLPGGGLINPLMRRIYRDALLEAELALTTPPPDPFDLERPHAFMEWLRAPEDSRSPIPRYFAAAWEESDGLHREFHRPHAGDSHRFLSWLRNGGWKEVGAPIELIPEAAPPPRLRQLIGSPRSVRPGVNIAGYFRAESGVGEMGRVVVRTVEAAGIPHAIVPYDFAPQRQELLFATDGRDRADYDVNVICVNADQMHAFAHDVGPRLFDGRHSVGLWWWEVTKFPEELLWAFDVVDEVWVGSDHVRDALEAADRGRVFRLPIPVDVPDRIPDPPAGRLGLPDRFTFLFSFDFMSVFERKNPGAIVEAYSRAFAPGEGAQLVLKTINGDRRMADMEHLRALIGRRPDILLMDAYLPAAMKTELIATCECYVSLHRAEGYGLGMAEAMALAKPVIATGYSGNLTFMNQANSYLVRHSMGPIPAGCEPYPQGSPWAEPDVDHAAELLRHVFSHPEEARARGRRGREDLRDGHSMEQTAAFLRERLAEIHRPSLAGFLERRARQFGRREWTGA